MIGLNFNAPSTGRPAAGAAEDVARLVAGSVPALVVEPATALVLAANAAAVDRLGLAGVEQRRLDPAMPAWAAIDAVLARQEAGAVRQLLVWWAASGPLALDATLEPVLLGDRRAVRIALPAADGASPKEKSRDSGEDGAAAAAREDTATLQEIARRIRSGLGSGPTVAEQPLPAGEPVVMPPALDFRQEPAPEPEEAHPEAVAAPTAVRKLAHELRTPLSAIAMLSEIMRDERLGAMGNDRYLSYAADIHETARHTLDLVETLLDGRFSAGNDTVAAGAVAAGTTLKLEPVDLADIVERCRSAMAPVAARADVRLLMTAEAGLPAARADRRAIKQIVLNLLSNALRFTSAGGEILLEVVRAPDGGHEIAVTDTGRGMTPAELASARGLDPARRTSRIAVAAGDGGNGFGLPIVRELAAAHGGQVIIDSAPEAGTTVRVLLPG